MARHILKVCKDRDIREQFVCRSKHDGSYDPTESGVQCDSDVMVVLSNCCIISPDAHVVDPRGVSVFRIVTACVPRGYERFVSEEDGVELRHDSVFELFPKSCLESVTRRHGPPICYEKIRYRSMIGNRQVSSADAAASVNATILGNKASTSSHCKTFAKM